MSENELKLKITVDKDGAVSGIEQIIEAEDRLKGSTGDVGLKFTELNSALELVRKGFVLVQDAVANVFTPIKEGAVLGDIAGGFNRLANDAGVLSDVLLNQLNDATGNTIRDFDLMRIANESFMKGLSPGQLVEAAAAARELSDTFGTELLTEYNQLLTALETGNVKILQNKIGIIDLNKAEKEFAETLGVKREQLSREGQLQAARLEIMRQMADEAERGRAIEDDAGDLIDQMVKNLDRQIDSTKRAMAESKELNKALATMSFAVSQIDFGFINKALITLATVAIDQANKALNYFIKILNDLKAVIDGFGKIKDAMKSDLFGDALKSVPLLGPVVKQLDQQFGLFNRTLAFAGQESKTTEEEVKKLDETLKITNETITENGEAIKVTKDDLAKYTIEVNKANEANKRFKGVDMGYGEYEPGASGVAGMPITEQISRQFSSEQFKNEIGAALAQSLGDGLDAALNGGNSEDFKQITKQFGAQAGQAAGSAIGFVIGGPIGAMIGGELGSVLGDKAGKAVFDAFNHVFGGGRDPGTKARKNVEAWFDKLLEGADLKIIKDDQLIDLKEFDRLGDAFEEDWAGHFKQIAGESTNTFSAIGEGLAGVIGVADELGSQIGYIMAENLGGSLNNLQLLFYKTGLSAEELRNQVLDAFMDGKISADEFIGALAGINQVMTEGIPDGIGMTSAALDNLFASSGRGIASLDALRDIFIEAGEVGITSFEGLRENLIAAGQSAQQVDALFKVLSDAGIGSFEQVLEGSDEFLIGLIANLDDAGFQFATLSTDVEDLAQKLDDLEREREIPITLAVSTRADPSSQRLIDAGALPGVA